MDLDKDFTGVTKDEKSKLPPVVEAVAIVLFCLVLVAVTAIIIGALAWIVMNVWRAAL